MTTKSKLLILASAFIALVLIGVITTGIFKLIGKNQTKPTSTKIPTAQGQVETGKGPVGPAKIVKSTIPPVTKVKVQITKNGFLPAKLDVRVNTILQIFNTTNEIFYIKSVGEKSLNVPNILPPSKAPLDLGIGYAGSYKLINQKNSAQTLEITAKN